MNEQGAALLVQVLAGVIGLGLFFYGRRQSRIPHLGAGLLLLVVPYFIPTWWGPLLFSIAIVGILIAGVKFGV